MTIFIVILGISLLILIHELGHFLVAKKMGLLVEEFGFGFPPRLFSKKIGETTYSLNLLPFGGFVKIYGEDQSDMTDPNQRIKPESTNKSEFTENKKIVEFVDLDRSRSFAYQPFWKRAAIIIAGVFMNFLLGWFLMSVIFFLGTPKALLISEILPNSPAEMVGLKAQDQLVSFKSAAEFIHYVNQNRGKEITLAVKRDGQELSVKATPRLSEQAALGVAVVEAGVERHTFFGSIIEGFKTSIKIIAVILAAFANLIWGLLTQGKVLVDFVGPIGIFGVASQAGALGFLYLVQLIAMISLNLTVLNILPFPALDGGRLLFVILEKIKGRPLSQNFERSANTIGFILLLLLMIAITIRDVARLF